MTSIGYRRQGDPGDEVRWATGGDAAGDPHGAWKADEPIQYEEVDPHSSNGTATAARDQARRDDPERG